MSTRSRPNLTEDQRCLILADYLDGKMLVREIAAKHGVMKSYPSALAQRTGVKMRRPRGMRRDLLFVATRTRA